MNPNFKKILIQTAIVSVFLFFSLFFSKTVLAVTYVRGEINKDTTWNLLGSPYVILDNVKVNPGVTLTIEPGVIVKFNYKKKLTVSGNLFANGSPLQKIYFTSIADDEVGGDTNGDGDETLPQPGDWQHIEFFDRSLGSFSDTVIRYAGFYIPVPMTGIHNDGGNVSVFRSQITLNGNTGIVQLSGLITVTDSEISHHFVSGISIWGGTASFSNNSIHDNDWFGLFNYLPSSIVNAKNNWWGDPTGPYHPILNPNGLGDRVSDGVDFIPWLTEDPWEKLKNKKPQVFNLGQFKSDQIMEIKEGNITTENTVVFKGTVSDPDEDKVKLQVEVKEFDQDFDGTNLLESEFFDSGSEVVLIKNDFLNGKYKWRARAVDDQDATSDWQEFGQSGNVDFEVKLVPLYTQVESVYPPRLPEDEWAYLDYADGKKYSCGSKIYQCGCAITSIVMIARYYGITEAWGKDVNPKEINEWLRNEPGGYQNGNVNWIAAAKYTNWRIQYERTDNTPNNYALLDEYLNKNQPVIAKEAKGRGGLPHNHFIVIDNKLATTYGIKDPAWYNTKTLDETTNITRHIRGYENGFDGLRIYKKGNGLAQSAIVFTLGSPAELLVIDPYSRKTGKDQNGIEYNEIPNAWYFKENYDDPTSEEPPATEENKALYILEPIQGEYKLNVIGTGNGSYSLYSSFYDNQGNPLAKEFHSEITDGQVIQYKIFFDPLDINNTQIEILDEIPPEAEIYFDKINQQLLVKGIDNITLDPSVSCSESGKETICQISDEAGNTTELIFSKLKQEGKEIKTELKSIRYNNLPLIEFPKTEIKYEWSNDKKTGEIKNLEQKISVKDQFDIQAKYNHEKDETKIKIKIQNKIEEQILPGLIIIKLIIKSGSLYFNF